jgi:hypothetical protein
MGRTCSKYGGKERCVQSISGETGGRNHLVDPNVDGRVILKLILEMRLDGSIDWIDLAQDRDRWRALVNAVMNLWIP